MKSDEKLKADIIEELGFDPAIEAAHIGVTCRNGVVSLYGRVDSYAEKTAAEHAVRRVEGVKAVAMELEIHLPSDKKTADDEIAERAVKILAWDAVLPQGSIGVEVEDGIVTLTGSVPWHYQRLEAEADIRKLSGVKGVVNGIEIAFAAEPADVRGVIERAFQRSAEIDAKGVTVTVVDGKVILGGCVNSWIEREIAERAAWSAPGVRGVEDHIAIARP
jgi:osmotically-inducible protein OsmY